MNASERIGTLAERLANRYGREWGTCRTCGTPTRSHQVGDGLQCHTCHENDERVVATDGGVPPGDQCAMCENEAIDPDHPHPLCEACLGDGGPAEDTNDGGAGADASEDPDDEGAGIDFQNPDAGIWPQERLEREQWMAHKPGEKKPFALWTDHDAPAPCDHHDGPTTCDECDHSARYKWGWDGNYLDGEGIAMVEDDHRVGGRVFLQQPDDPYAYLDGDDVRDSQTGEVHPDFIDIIKRLGTSYTDISLSDSGVHAVYRGELPDGVKEASWKIDDEPWGDNDDLPSVEIYAGKRVCVDTGKHVPGTPLEINEWDADALEDLLDENDQLPVENTPAGDREQLEWDDYEPTATTATETTDDIRDIYRAIDRLNVKKVAEKTIVHRWNDSASTSDGARAFYPMWGKDSNGTANYVNDKIWHDTGDGGGYGGPVVMALIHAGEMRHRNASPRKARGKLWWDGVDHLRELGFDIPDHDDGDGPHNATAGDPCDECAGFEAVVPHTPPSEEWDWRTAARAASADEMPGLSEYRERVTEEIEDAFEYGKSEIIAALPSMGKSYGAVEAAFKSGEPATVLTSRHDLYDQYAEWADDRDMKKYKLPSMPRDCPTASGEFGDEWQDRVMGWYQKAATPQAIHAHAENHLGRPLPCQEDGECPYSNKWDFDPDDKDLLIGHYTHGYHENVTSGRHVIYDEFPGGAYTTHLEGPEFKQAVSEYVGDKDALPFENYVDLLSMRDDDERVEQAMDFFDGKPEPDPEEVIYNDNTHALAPVAAFAMLKLQSLDNGLERARLPGGDRVVFNPEDTTLSIVHTPDLTYSKSTVCLDGTPTRLMWQTVLDENLDMNQPFTVEERKHYVANTLGINVVKTTDNILPFSSGNYVSDRNKKEVSALLETIEQKYGEQASVITTKKAKKKYDDADILDKADDAEHHGNIKGTNRLASKRLGVIIGSRHYGDSFIKRWGAFNGVSVEANGERGADRSYGQTGDKILGHMRENETLQALLRFGRDGGGATVFSHTNTLPDWVPIHSEGATIEVFSEGMKDVISATKGAESFDTSDIAAECDLSARQVLTHLKSLTENGYVEQDRGGNGHEWTDAQLGMIAEDGFVDLQDVEIDSLSESQVSEVARKITLFWSLRTKTVSDSSGGADSEEKSLAADGGDAEKDPPE